ncbi:piezo-type mechanosensitive ion channel component isoform X2 [Onthophagus taurus]|uniref:piezo-type mechanosensitive ion channel component isoform X2 n=1 Tax=Onthophagus taurus TaxID=166361 RepID=UPI0039BE5DAD
MANVLCTCLFRILLPLIILPCVVFRPSALSAIYLIAMLCSPFIAVPTYQTMRSCTGVYLKILMAISLITSVLLVSFHVYLIAVGSYGNVITDNELLETILRYCGLVRLDKADFVTIITWISPELLMLISSITIFVLTMKLTKRNIETETGEEQTQSKAKMDRMRFLVGIGKFTTLILLCICACLKPSVQGGLYFVVFICTATWRSCSKNLGRGFAVLMQLLMVVVFVHIFALLMFQIDYFQDFLGVDSPYRRYFALTIFYTIDKSDPRRFIFAQNNWDAIINPFMLIALFYVSALTTKELIKPQPQIKPGAFSRLEGSFNGPLRRQISQRLSDRRLLRSTTTRNRWHNATRKVRLMRGISPSRRYGSDKKKGASILQDSTGSVTVTGDQTRDFQTESNENLDEEEKIGCFENCVFVMGQLLQSLVQLSYIVTNIIMMTWSITYHSWLTFVLLIWANILWIMPKQRRAMLRSSPFLVFYAIFLLISGYIFSMDLTDAELPSKLAHINLAQIGFVKYVELPCLHLWVKCCFTVMFWFTLKQYTIELKEERQKRSLADMAAPLQVSVQAAAGVQSSPSEQKKSKVISLIGSYLRHASVRLWIWVVAITLFVVAITGERMTVFRILYMALFLIFILTFQISFNLWRQMMFIFLLIVIIYSMLILILVYTYQFDNFETYWTEYLHVPKEQQLDIGLETYKTTQLFVRLATPTCFVIVTVIQLHYFHPEFKRLTDILGSHQEVARTTSLGTSSMPGSTSERNDSYTSDKKLDLTDVATIHSENIRRSFKNFWRKVKKAIDLIYIYLEIQMHRLVLIIAALMCIYDKCALYCVVTPLVVLGIMTGRGLSHLIIKVISIYTAVKLISQMIYQVNYIRHEWFDANCTITSNTTNNVTGNNAEWLGFFKSNNMASIVEWNIAYIAVATLYSVILIRQYSHRIKSGQPQVRPFFVFPNIRRFDADKSVYNALKFLVNHGYYKFGYEISLITTVCLIGIRMDMYGLFYAIWLSLLCFIRRDILRAGMWTLYLFFIAITIPIQYFLSVGIPPSLCVVFPWDDMPLLRRLQEWAFLLDTAKPPRVERLVCDFVLLLMVSRQRVVFRIEDRFKNRDYPGGSNDSIIHLAETKDFVNPVPDYITFVRSYLDIIKRGVLLSFMWLTLAAIFLAGANRINIFSIGYLLGSFLFLWHGTDLYLKPLRLILKSWECLIAYSVIVIFLKAVFQFSGCVWVGKIPLDYCWVAQLFAIGCVDKSIHENNIHVVEECEIPSESIGLAWDGICFAFLIMQRMLFSSYNFFHIIDETKASTILASRGADLIEVLRQRRVQEQLDHEKLILEKIKLKMDRIKATQEKIRGPNYQEVNNHAIDTLYPRSRPLYRRKIPKTNKEAIRSGDYYMFDDMDDDDELDIIETTKQQSDDEDGETGENLSTLLSKTLKTDVNTVVRKDKLRRRASMPVDRQRSTISAWSHARSAPPTIEESPSKSKKQGDSTELIPKPGPSKPSEDDDNISEGSEHKNTKCQTVLVYLIYAWKLIESIMVSVIRILNKHSRDFRYVRRVLIQEKKILKETSNYTEGIRIGRSKIWQPAHTYQALLSSRDATSGNTINSQNEETEHSGEPSTKPKETSSQQSSPESSGMIEFEEGEISQYDQPTIIRLMIAIWYIVMSNSEILCYIMIFVNQMQSATFLSLSLPFLVFFWGTLAIPRPSKSFWVTIIAYTQTVVLIKCIFQFEFWTWNQTNNVPDTNPFYPPRIIGVEQNSHYAVWNLSLLLVVYFHRYLLKSLGLWTAAIVTVPLLHEGDYVVQELQKDRTLKDHAKLSASDDENDDDEDKSITVAVKTEYAEPIDMFPDAIHMSTVKYFELIKVFLKQLRDPTSRASDDVYSYMFLCDFFNFFVILFGYSSFGEQQGDGGVQSYLQDNRVPPLFLLMLIVQFLLIIVDRAIYLRKNITAKIVFQFVQIIVLHGWLFILFPLMTDRYFNSTIAPQLYYMVKCFYLLLSAYQIRCGYPARILGNFLCKSYNYVNKILFLVFMVVPFLFELRTVMDWMWTDTSMTVFDWIKMEDIFATIFQIKCTRRAELEYPQPRGQKKSPIAKYIMGGGILVVIIAIIWFPLVFFSLGNAVGQTNVPYDVTLSIRIGPYEPVYQLSAQNNSIFSFNQSDYEIIEETYKQNKAAFSFISNYREEDIAAVKLSGDSSTVWTISPPDRNRMIAEVASMNPLQIQLQYQISHNSSGNKNDPGTIREIIEIMMPAVIDDQLNPERQNLLRMLWGNETDVPPVRLGYILPKFLKVTNRGTAQPVKLLMDDPDNPEQSYLRTLNLTLSSHSSNQSDSIKYEWWTIQENCSDINYRVYLRKLSYGDCSAIVLYTFNDRIFPPTLNIITAGGIIGVYTTLVFLVSRFLRGFFSEICFKIMFDDMPNVDRVLQLCHDIYLVREAGEFCLEEDLFAKLVFLFRSPETLIKWTRPKEDGEDEDNPEGDN